jgi:hypothetical protein
MSMEASGVSLAVSVLRDAYPRADFPDRSVVLYASMLADLDDLLVVEATRRLVRRSTFLPSIAEIRREVAEAVLGLPTATEAWAIVNEPASAGNLPTLVQASLNALGGRWALRMSERPEIFMTNFVKDYGSRREHALLGIMGANTHGSELSALPVSDSIGERPVFSRIRRRLIGEEVGDATEEERGDAIRILEAGPVSERDPLYAEAFSILDQSGR